jgi:membrane peptidoglycan carboxypeptidase
MGATRSRLTRSNVRSSPGPSETHERGRGAAVLSGIIGLVSLSVLAGMLVAIGVTPLVGVTGVTAASGVGVFEDLPEFIELGRLPERNTIYAQSSSAEAVNGYIPIATVFDQNRQDVALANISPWAQWAAIDGEDKRFYDHGGVDTRSIVRAAAGNFGAGGVESGASTLTMQLVKNTFVQQALTEPTQQLRQQAYNNATEPGFGRKLNEMKLAIALEKKYTKEEILAAYLNISFFGDDTYGIQAAAQRYFSVSAADLTIAQAASLIAIVQYPSQRSLDTPENFEANENRRDEILLQMYLAGHISKMQYQDALREPIDESSVTPSTATNGCVAANVYARWFCDYVVKNVENFDALGATPAQRAENWAVGGYDLYTTLDMDVQVSAQDLVWAYANSSETQLNLGASSVSVQPGTGRIITMSENKIFNDTLSGGGIGASAVNYNTAYAYGGSSGFQSGSTYKLFTLVAWLQAGHRLSEVVDGSARTVQQNKFVDTCTDSYGPWGGPYPFKNDGSGGGGISVLSATSQSVNGAFISMALKLDLCNIRSAAESLGVERADGDVLWTNPSSVLGTNEVTPLSMAAAYAAIAAGGVYCTPIVLDRVVGPGGGELPGQVHECSQGVSPEVAATAAYALSTVMAGGTGSSSNPGDGIPIIGKTGTTDNANQTWIVTSTTAMATAVWVGNTIGEASLKDYYWAGYQGSQLRHAIMASTMAVIDAKYGGGQFPGPDRSML